MPTQKKSGEKSDDQTGDRDGKRKTTLIAYLLLLFIVMAVTCWMVAPYMLAVATGIICAIILRPGFEGLRKKRVGPKTAAGLLSSLLMLVLIGPVSGFIAAAIDEGVNLSRYVTSEQFPSFNTITQYISEWKPIESLIGDPSTVEKQIRSGIQTAARTTTAAVLGLIGSIPELGLQLFLVIITCYFSLVDGRRCLVWMRERVPLDRDVRERLVASFRDTAISSIWATMAAAAAQAAIMLFAFLVLDVPAAFLAAGATFIFSWIPILGSAPVWISGAVYLYMQPDSVGRVILMIVFGIITSIADNIVRPVVLKGRDDMHPLISLIAIFGGIYLLGILGVFFGPIVMAIFLSLLNIWPAISTRFGLMDDRE